MADVKRIDLVDIDLDSGKLPVSRFTRIIGTGDNNGNGFGVRVFRSGTPVDLTGVSVQGYFRDPKGTNKLIDTGNVVSGNEAYVILKDFCYNFEGQFSLAVKLLGSGVTGTVRIITGMVENTNADNAISPAPSQTSYADVLAVFQQVQPLANAGGIATVAETKSHLGIS